MFSGVVRFAQTRQANNDREMLMMAKRFWLLMMVATITAVLWGSVATAQDDRRALEEVDGSPALVGDYAELVVMSPNGRYIYVANEETITAFSFDNGDLREVDGSPFYVAGDYFRPIDMVISPDGRYLYVAHRGFVGRSLLSPVSGYLIQERTGALIELRNSPFTTYSSSGRGLNQVALMPNGNFLYALNTDDKTIHVFRVNANTGNLYENGVVEVGGPTFTPTDIAISPNNAYLYAANQGFTDDGAAIPLSIYRIDNRNGNLTEARQSPYDLPADGTLGLSAIAVHPSGNYLFVLNTSARTLTVIAMENRTTPVASATIRVGSEDYEPYALAINPNGDRIFISNHGFVGRSLLSPLTVVTFSDRNGTMRLNIQDSIDVISQEDGLGHLTVSPDGAFVLQTNPAVSALHVFALND